MFRFRERCNPQGRSAQFGPSEGAEPEAPFGLHVPLMLLIFSVYIPL